MSVLAKLRKRALEQCTPAAAAPPPRPSAPPAIEPPTPAPPPKKKTKAEPHSSLLLTESHRPTTVSGVVGNTRAKGLLLKYIRAFSGPAPPLLAVVWGPPGVGKSTLAAAALKENNYDVVEMNASMTRRWGEVSGCLTKHLPFKNPFTSRKQAVIMDEADGMDTDITAAALCKHIEGLPARAPVILIANSKEPLMMRELCRRKNVVECHMPALERADLAAICYSVGHTNVPDGVLMSGDARAALNYIAGGAIKTPPKNPFTTADTLLRLRVQRNSVPTLFTSILSDLPFHVKLCHDNLERTISASSPIEDFQHWADNASDLDCMNLLEWKKPDVPSLILAQWAAARTERQGLKPHQFIRQPLTVRRIATLPPKIIGSVEWDIMRAWPQETIEKWLQAHPTVTLSQLKALCRDSQALPAAWVRAFRDTLTVEKQ